MLWMNNPYIEIVEIEGEFYALYGWNGEEYLHCWKCLDAFTAAPDGKEYEVREICSEEENEFGCFDILGYEVC